MYVCDQCEFNDLYLELKRYVTLMSLTVIYQNTKSEKIELLFVIIMLIILTIRVFWYLLSALYNIFWHNAYHRFNQVKRDSGWEKYVSGHSRVFPSPDPWQFLILFVWIFQFFPFHVNGII